MLNYLRTRNYKGHFIRFFVIVFLIWGFYGLFFMICSVGNFINLGLVIGQTSDISALDGLNKVFYYVSIGVTVFIYAAIAYYWLLFTCWMIKKSYVDQAYLVAGPLLALFLNLIGFFIYCLLPKPHKKE